VEERRSADFVCEPDPANPGWHTWNLVDRSRFNSQMMGDMIVRREIGPGDVPFARLRFVPERRHSNIQDAVHGAVTLGLIDISLFAAAHILLGGNAASAVTLDVSTQFIGRGMLDQALDAVVEVLRETGRLVFLRGKVEQECGMVAAFSATIRKVRAL
jgi:acyl-coenzyme A thioesterase PaaI-like protein